MSAVSGRHACLYSRQAGISCTFYKTMKEKYLISACLVGELCRYDGKTHANVELMKVLERAGCELIPVCPEMLGGLKTPRAAAQITEGDGIDVLNGDAVILDESGANVTDKFIAGAKKVLDIVKANSISSAIFNERSPSCGVKSIYNSGSVVKGRGVTTALMTKNGIKIVSDEEFLLDIKK